jgi:hypothetical protein
LVELKKLSLDSNDYFDIPLVVAADMTPIYNIRDHMKIEKAKKDGKSKGKGKGKSDPKRAIAPLPLRASRPPPDPIDPRPRPQQRLDHSLPDAIDLHPRLQQRHDQANDIQDANPRKRARVDDTPQRLAAARNESKHHNERFADPILIFAASIILEEMYLIPTLLLSTTTTTETTRNIRHTITSSIHVHLGQDLRSLVLLGSHSMGNKDISGARQRLESTRASGRMIGNLIGEGNRFTSFYCARSYLFLSLSFDLFLVVDGLVLLANTCASLLHLVQIFMLRNFCALCFKSI